MDPQCRSPELQIRRLAILLAVVLGALLGSASTRAQAQSAEVLVEYLNCREYAPRFSPLTIITFELRQGPIIKTLRKGDKVRTIDKAVVGKKDSWVYVELPDNKRCWVYEGPNGRYLKTIPQSRQELSPQRIRAALNQTSSLIGVAHAASNDQKVSSEASKAAPEPDLAVNPLRNIAVGGCYLAIFLGAMVVIRRYVFPGSATLTFLMSFSILLILGFISKEQFPSALTNFVIAASK